MGLLVAPFSSNHRHSIPSLFTTRTPNPTGSRCRREPLVPPYGSARSATLAPSESVTFTFREREYYKFTVDSMGSAFRHITSPDYHSTYGPYYVVTIRSETFFVRKEAG